MNSIFDSFPKRTWLILLFVVGASIKMFQKHEYVFMVITIFVALVGIYMDFMRTRKESTK